MKKSNKKIISIMISITFLLSGVMAFKSTIPSSAAEGVVGNYGRLQVYDSYVCSESGQQISLGGMSFSWSNWFGEYYTASTVDFLVDTMGVSLIRAAYGVPENEGPSNTVGLIETVVDRAIERGIYAIIDFHIEGDATQYQDSALSFFRDMAQKYGNTPNVMYELWNEPTSQSNSVIQNYCQTVANEIRKYDSDNLIICGSNTWSQYPQSYSISDPNVAYTFHGYFDDPSWGDAHINQFYTNVQAAMNMGNAVFVTEFGANYDDHDGTAQIIQACQDMKISMAAWSACSKVEPWSIFSSGYTLTDWGNYLKNEFQTWPDAETGTDWTLTTSVFGSGSVTPSGGSFPDGASVTLTATPSAGWTFSGWSGDVSSNTNPLTITMNSNTHIIATFTDNPDNQPPAAPTGLSASATGTTSISLNWNDNSESDFASYTIYRSTSSDFTPSGTTQIASSTSSAYSDSGLNEATTYYYKVTATDTSGNVSPASSQASATTETGTTPPPPTGDTITAPFTQDGAGDFTWKIAEIPNYVNSWNLKTLTINGVDFTNEWVGSWSLPAKVDGFYTIHYVGNYRWSHLEIK